MLKYVSGDFPAQRGGSDGCVPGVGRRRERASSAPGPRAHTVEHHPEWCAAIREWDEIKCLRGERVASLCRDVAGGRARRWPSGGGRPQGSTRASSRTPTVRPGPGPVRRRARRVRRRVDRREDAKARARAQSFRISAPIPSSDGDFSEDWGAVEHPDATLDVIDREQGHNVDRMYAKGAGRVFDKVERRGRLAIFKLKPAIAKQTGWVE